MGSKLVVAVAYSANKQAPLIIHRHSF